MPSGSSSTWIRTKTSFISLPVRVSAAAEAAGELVAADVDAGGAAVGASLGQVALLELAEEVAHLVEGQGLAGAHGGVAGEGGGDPPLRVGRAVFTGEEVEELAEGAGRVVRPEL